jgi:hypothetical protein
MRKEFLFSAAVLVATTGFAAAQGTGSGGASAPSSAPAQSSPAGAPADRSAPSTSTPSTSKDAPSTGSPKTTQSDKMAPKAGDTKNESSAPKNAGSAPATDQKAGTTPSSNTKAGSDTKSGTSPDAKGGAAAAAPPAEKQSQITSAIKSEKVEEVTNVNFNIAVGSVVPSGVHYYPLPSRIVEIYPQWRGYGFIRVRGKYIILRPQTHEIVYIIEG